MAISHICLQCGFDMARVRARPEPHYGLPLVVCPDCGSAAVRRRPRALRTTVRVAGSLSAVGAQMAMLGLCMGTVIAMCIDFGEALVDGGPGVMSRQELTGRLLAFGVLSLTLGAWLTAGFSHVLRQRSWTVFSCIAMVMLALDRQWDQYPARLLVLATIMTAAVAGMPLGKSILFIWGRTRRGLLNGYRRRLRARSGVS